jgi:hypothetical protein
MADVEARIAELERQVALLIELRDEQTHGAGEYAETFDGADSRLLPRNARPSADLLAEQS